MKIFTVRDSRLWRSRKAKIVVILLVLSIVAKIYDVATRPEVEREQQTSVVNTFNPSNIEFPDISNREELLAEFPEYGKRHVEQTFLTLPEWYQVYSYNEFGDYLVSGGAQSRFPFLSSIKNFWSYYFIAVRESKDEKFNWQYNFVDWIIGLNLTMEYFIKSVYENSIGGITQLLAGSNSETDHYIAESWNNYAKRMYQYTWYHYPYFTDLKGIWTETPLFDKDFIRNLERKIAFSVSYAIKGTYAKAWLLTAAQKANETYSIVHALNRENLGGDKVEVLKDLGENLYLIKTERYAGFKNVMLELLERGVDFVEIMGHETIALSYLSNTQSEPFSDTTYVNVVDKRELYFNPKYYTHRVVLEARVRELRAVIDAITQNGSEFEMIYDF